VARGRIVDLGLVGGLFAADVVAQGAVGAGADWPSPPLSPLAVVLAGAGAAPLWWRRRRPLLVAGLLVVAALVAAGATAPGLLTQQLGVTLVIGLYGAASWSERRRAVAAVGAVLLAVVVAGAVSDGAGVAQAVLAGGAVAALPWALGCAVRTRRLYVEEVERRLAVAERDRDTQAREAVAAERTRIARELHDVVAHHVSLIGVQAGAARTTLPPAADASREALTAIESSSRAAVREMRQLLGVLRDGDRDRAGDAVEPPPGLGRLDALVADFRAAGIEVTADVDVTAGGDGAGIGPDGLDPVLDVCCYRVVEEALTNVARHSTARRATVTVRVGPASMVVRVDDPGPAAPPPPGPPAPGRGLIGMAERVALFGGRLTTGPRPGGGFGVEAELPRPRP